MTKMTPDQNKASARAVFDVWSSGDLQKLDEIVASDVIHHDRYDPHGRDGLEGMKKSIARTRSLYPDFRMTVHDQLVDGDKVATRWTADMTHEGKQVSLHGITIDRFEHGKIVEAWRSMDMLGFRQQLGMADDTQLRR